MPRSLRFASLVAIIVVGVTTASWLLRRPLSEAVVARWFASRSIPARYRITALSTDAVSLSGVTIGATAAPDFQADHVDVRLGWSLFRPSVAAVTLVRPSLHAVVGPHGLSLGSLDRLLPSPGSPAQPLPDFNLTLIDARATVATRAGSIVVTGRGAGRLRSGFAGRFTVGDTLLAASGCSGRVPGASLVVSTTYDAVRLIGDGTATAFACAGGSSAVGIGWHADVRLPTTLDRYTVRLAARSGQARFGKFAAVGLDGTADGAAATLAGPVAGTFAVAARGVGGPSSGAGRIAAHGYYRVDAATGDASLTATVAAVRANVALPLRPLRAVGVRFAGTLAGPLADALAARLDAAARAFDATGTLVLARRSGATTASLADVTISAATGARIVQSGRIALAGTGIGADGGIALTGGELPGATLTGVGHWEGGTTTGGGALSIARWAVAGAAVEASRLAFAATPTGVTIAGTVRVSGALGGGTVANGLGLPIDARIDRDGGVVFGGHCLPLDWSSLERGDIRLAAGRVVACPTADAMVTIAGDRLRGGATFGDTALRGSAGGADFALAATPVRIGVSGTTSRARIEVGAVTVAGQVGARRARATIDGAFDIGGGSGRGRVSGAALDDPASPVGIDDGSADWRLTGTRIDLDNATARITDRTTPARFQPLRIADVTGSLADGVAIARGNVLLAASKARLAHVDVGHDIASGRGTARLDTGTLVFGPTLQPADITEQLRGIIANVRGPVIGTGEVDWTPTGITSRGTLRLDKLALATEALGPVDGIAGTIAFDDLLALTTPPAQSLTVARINPGVVVDDGVVVFRMLGPDAASIASIRWPYAGGTLVLAPVTIRAGDLRRDFRLTVDGIDAQQFLQRFEIKNLNVTGRFDGTLPLVFADGRGRIAGGRLVAREGGGLIQYVGEIGTADTGATARLAFDALRRLRYRNLTLDLDGDLDGELVTQLHFAGSNEAATTLGGGPLPVKVTGLPFRFGITVRAPFRALLGTAASFSDVRPLLRAAPPPQTVQPK